MSTEDATRASSFSSAIEEVITIPASPDENDVHGEAESDEDDVVRLEEGITSIEASCIIRAIPIVCSQDDNNADGCLDGHSIAAITAPTLSLSRSFGGSFGYGGVEATATFDTDDNSANDNVVSTTDSDDVVLVMDEEGAVESHIITTARATGVFLGEAGSEILHSSSDHVDIILMSSSSLSSPSSPLTTTTLFTSRAEFVSATVIKKTDEDNVGITLTGRGQNQDDIRIASIDEDGLLYNSPLRVGDQLLSIAGKSCFELDNAAAAEQLLRQAPAGIVSLVARNPTGSVQYVETCIEKSSPTSPVGISMKHTEHGSLIISNIVASGLFAHSLINVGDRVLAINNEHCPQGLNMETAIEYIRDSPRYVSILTETQSRAGVVVPSAEEGLQGTVVPTDENGQVLSAAAEAALKRSWWRRHFCSILLAIALAVVVLDLLVIHPL